MDSKNSPRHDAVGPAAQCRGPVSTVRTQVLLLEGEAEVAALIQTTLRTGFEITRASSAAEGLRCLMTQRYDIVLCDTGLPACPVDMFLLAGQRTQPDLAARFLFTRRPRTDSKVDAFIRSVTGTVLRKPFDPGQLLDAVRKVLRGGRSD
jgi:DNA-binding response OmpR family regulator